MQPFLIRMARAAALSCRFRANLSSFQTSTVFQAERLLSASIFWKAARFAMLVWAETARSTYTAAMRRSCCKQ